MAETSWRPWSDVRKKSVYAAVRMETVTSTVDIRADIIEDGII